MLTAHRQQQGQSGYGVLRREPDEGSDEAEGHVKEASEDDEKENEHLCFLPVPHTLSADAHMFGPQGRAVGEWQLGSEYWRIQQLM